MLGGLSNFLGKGLASSALASTTTVAWSARSARSTEAGSALRMLDLKGFAQHRVPLRSLLTRQDGKDFCVQLFLMLHHHVVHLLRIHALAFSWSRHRRAIGHHDLVQFLPLIVGDAQLFADIRSEDSHRALLLQADLLIAAIL